MKLNKERLDLAKLPQNNPVIIMKMRAITIIIKIIESFVNREY